jgi:hypothetical protein
VVLGFLDQSFHIPATHKLGDHVGLVLLLSQVEDGDDVRMGAESSHCLGLSLDAAAARFVQPLGLDQGKGDFPVQQGVVGQVDLLFPAFAQEILHLVAAIGERRGLGKCRSSIGSGGRFGQGPVQSTCGTLGGLNEGDTIRIVWVQGQY